MSTDREDEIRRAETEMHGMLKRIAEAKPGKMTSGMEKTYGNLYQRLVRLGARPQIRRKYRG